MFAIASGSEDKKLSGLGGIRHGRGVTEVVSTLILLTVTVLAISVLAALVLSQPPPEKTPHVEIHVVSTTDGIYLRHAGGDPLRRADIKILVDGVDRTADFYKGNFSNPQVSKNWTVWRVGEILFLNDTGKKVKIIYKSNVVVAVGVLEEITPSPPTPPPSPTPTPTPTPTPSPPPSVSGLRNVSYAPTYIKWVWKNPDDENFAHVMIYVDGIWRVNTTAESYTATNLLPNTEHTISTKTVGRNGLINETWANHTARTAPDSEPPKVELKLLDENGDEIANNSGISGTVLMSAEATDISGVRLVTFYVDHESRGIYPSAEDAAVETFGWPHWHLGAGGGASAEATEKESYIGAKSVEIRYRRGGWAVIAFPDDLQLRKSKPFKPGDEYTVQLAAKWLSGDNRIWLGFDLYDNKGRWLGDAVTDASVEVPKDGAWHVLKMTAEIPSKFGSYEYDDKKHYIKPKLVINRGDAAHIFVDFITGALFVESDEEEPYEAKFDTKPFKGKKLAFYALALDNASNLGASNVLVETVCKDFKYRRPIVIRNDNKEELKDFQVRVVLNAANFDFSKTKSDGSDIRFKDGDRNLPYWIEKWDSRGKEAIVWVKVPELPARSEKTVYMYYGNPNASSESDGAAVFEFFDDFEGYESWDDMEKAGWQREDCTVEIVKDGTNKIVKLTPDTKTHWQHGIINGNIKLETYIYELRWKQKRSHAGRNPATGPVFHAKDLDNWWALEFYNGPGTIFRPVIDGKDRGWVHISSAFRAKDERWYELRIVIKPERVVLFVDGVKKVAFKIAPRYRFSGYEKVGLVAHRYHGYAFADDLRVRKYAEKEPSVIVGSEENA